ncbi:ArsR/SmtB family transcription factor [Bacillus sp. FJAT-27245]|uniref:ArsR/SmtB family transcription factor n=1 Tax=Bacillus sp. FJAT-27245 TaxID=1684144 RepID=UPI0006A763C7|nr:metalloregulator ArsR/SmtB family transcription factor [Bacillus sp. FJAT-27245]
MTEDFKVKLYKALGETTRLQIVEILAKHPELSCQEIADQLHIAANSTLTYHLKPLLDCGLLSVRQAGTFRYYSLKRTVLEKYAPALL